MNKIIVVAPGRPPEVRTVKSTWQHWYGIVGDKTDRFEALALPDHIEMLFDKDQRHSSLHARAPTGVEIYGTFLLVKREDEGYGDLTDDDITWCQKFVEQVRHFVHYPKT